MRTINYLLTLIVGMGGLMVSCDTDIESESIQHPYTYSDLYYQNLRDFKAIWSTELNGSTFYGTAGQP